MIEINWLNIKGLRRKAFGMACVALALVGANAHAGKVTKVIRAGNPAGCKTQALVQIRFDLPAQVRTNDIISLDGLELGYDVGKDLYYVHKDVWFNPKESDDYRVELNDIWCIPKTDLDAMMKQARVLVAKLAEKKDSQKLAMELQKEIEKNIKAIELSQDANAIKPGVDVVRHMMAFESDSQLLKRVKKDIRSIENLVLGAGLDPGQLVEDDRAARSLKQRKDPETPIAYGTVILSVRWQNPSPTQDRKIPVKYELPPEIKAVDVLDAGGLKIGADPRSGISYVHSDSVDIGAGKTVTFVLKLNDKWNVNKPRIGDMKTIASNILARISVKEKFSSVEQTLRGLIAELDSIAKEEGPKEFNETYVVFYREQASRLDVVEQKLNRIESAMRPIETGSPWGFNVEAPSSKTTWLIIYIILIFLGVMSLLFFLRWFGKSGQEKMPGTTEPPENPPPKV